SPALRIDFTHPSPSWRPGQHYYLCFPALSIWQSHPFTTASLPPTSTGSAPHHTYIIRALSGETAKLAALARDAGGEGVTTPVILTGPYGAAVTPGTENLLAVAGGTGISFALPVVLAALNECGGSRAGLVQLVWVVRRVRDLKWVEGEMGVLRERAREGGVDVRVFVTREGGPEEVEKDVVVVSGDKEVEDGKIEGVVGTDTTILEKPEEDSVNISIIAANSSGFSITYLGGAHPDLGAVVRDYIERCPASGGRIEVMGSGPAGIGSALRSVVAECNDGRKVGRGEEKADVGLYWDDRLL
ncbi:hypothetical protein V495_06522, partial [Pseudogymnoascus sp. VKM F-4514 (FW-929)]